MSLDLLIKNVATINYYKKLTNYCKNMISTT